MKKQKLTARRFFHEFFKYILIILITVLALTILLLTGIHIYHTHQLKKEAGDLKRPGILVNVNGHKMHVVKGGKEKSGVTLVFLHSSKVTDDSIALQPLFDEIKEDTAYAYVDRSGYGFSEVSGTSRDMDTVLSETRDALKAADVKSPYILVPVGTAGLEALYWADKYPAEVQEIVGIDMNVPESFSGITQEQYCGFFDYISQKFLSLGGIRMEKGLYPDNQFGVYTSQQMKTRDALISRNPYSKDMYAEDLMMIQNAETVKNAGWPSKTPMVLLYSNPVMKPYSEEDAATKETMEKAVKSNPDVDYEKEYNREIRETLAGYRNVEMKELSGPSRLYTYKPEEVAEVLLEEVKN